MGHLVFEGNLYNVNHLIDFIAFLYITGVLLHVRYIIFFYRSAIIHKYLPMLFNAPQKINKLYLIPCQCYVSIIL